MATPTELSREELERRAALGMIELDDDDLLTGSTHAKPRYQIGTPEAEYVDRYGSWIVGEERPESDEEELQRVMGILDPPWYERAIETVKEYGQPLLPDYPERFDTPSESFEGEKVAKRKFKEALRQAKIGKSLEEGRPVIESGPGGEVMLHEPEPYKPLKIQPESFEGAVDQAHWGLAAMSMADPTMMTDLVDAALYKMMGDPEMARQVVYWSAGGLGAGALVVKLARVAKVRKMRRSLQSEFEAKGYPQEAAEEASGRVFDLAAVRWEQKMRGDLPVSSQYGRGRGEGSVIDIERTPEGGIRETPEPDMRQMVEEDPAAREEFMDFLAKEERELQARRAAESSVLREVEPPVLREVEPPSALDRFNEELVALRELSNKANFHPDLDDKLFELDMMNEMRNKWLKSPEDAWRLKEVENVYESFEKSGNLEKFSNDLISIEKTTPEQYKYRQSRLARRAAEPQDLKLHRQSGRTLEQEVSQEERARRATAKAEEDAALAKIQAKAKMVLERERLSTAGSEAVVENQQSSLERLIKNLDEIDPTEAHWGRELSIGGRLRTTEDALQGDFQMWGSALTGKHYDPVTKSVREVPLSSSDKIRLREAIERAEAKGAVSGQVAETWKKQHDLLGPMEAPPTPSAPKKSSGSLKRWGKGAEPAHLKGDVDLPQVTGRTWDADDGATFHEITVDGESRWINNRDLDEASMEVPPNAAGTGPWGVPGKDGGLALTGGLYRSSTLPPKPRPGYGGTSRAPWQMTREEFEATGEELMHGTDVPFDRFMSKVAKDRYGKAMGRGKENLERFYFTEQPNIARSMSDATRSGGHKTIDFDKWMEITEGGSLQWDDPEWDEMLDKMQAAVRQQMERKPGSVLAYIDYEKGPDLIRVKDPSEIPREVWVEGSDVRLYQPGRWPRVIKTNVYGRTLDLTDPKNIPDDLANLLKKEGLYDPTTQGGGWQHEFSAALVKYARENNYGKIKVRDGHESGGRSTIGIEEYIGYGVDPHHAFVEKAIREGKDVPEEVLRRYPDLYALKFGTPKPPRGPSGGGSSGAPTPRAPEAPAAKIVTSQKVLDKVWLQTDGQPNLRRLNEKIKGESKYYEQTLVPLDDIKPMDDMADVDFRRADELKGPIVIGRDGVIIDGHHRYALALNRGDKSIEVYRPIKAPPRAPEAPAAGVVETATDASVAGAKTPADVKVAQSMWKKMGVLSPYFKKWFGGSKVVDKAGKPLRVHHGSGTSKIDQFKHEKAGGLFWFTPKRPVAESYALNRRGVNMASEDAWEDALESGVIDDTFENFVTDAYLSLKNPLDLRDPEAFRVLADLDPEFGAADTSEYGQELARKVINQAKSIEKGGSDYQFWMVTQHEKGAHAWSNILTPQLEARGYDGLIMNDAADTGLAYAAFKPTQIKSVKNRGTFDPTDPRIMYGVGLPPAAVLKSQLRKDED